MVGAPGHGGSGSAYVFEQSGTSLDAEWPSCPALTPLPATTFGASVSISGTLASSGAGPRRLGQSVRVWEHRWSWTQAAEVAGSDTATSDTFGAAVGISGAIAVVGAPGHAGGKGSAYLFSQQSGGSWTQAAELQEGSAAQPGITSASRLQSPARRRSSADRGHGGTGIAEVYAA